MSQKKRIYIESTIPSYITADDSTDKIKLGRQEAARRFWNTKRTEYELFISEPVIEEIGKGDPVYAKKRLALVAGIERLKSTPEIDTLAAVYKKLVSIPDRAKLDAVHLAIAVMYEDVFSQAKAYSEKVRPAMEAVRTRADALEKLTAKTGWPYPGYGDMLFKL